MNAEKVELTMVEDGPSGERCDKCYYWIGCDDGSVGLCKRYPPKASVQKEVAIALNARDKMKHGGDEEYDFDGNEITPYEKEMFGYSSPSTGEFIEMHDDDWCGEFRPRPQPKE